MFLCLATKNYIRGKNGESLHMGIGNHGFDLYTILRQVPLAWDKLYLERLRIMWLCIAITTPPSACANKWRCPENT